jgi:hypothetical protein
MSQAHEIRQVAPEFYGDDTLAYTLRQPWVWFVDGQPLMQAASPATLVVHLVESMIDTIDEALGG